MDYKKILGIILALLMAFISCILYYSLVKPSKNQIVIAEPTYVETTPIQEAQWNVPFKTFANVASQFGVTVSAETSGRLTQVAYDEPTLVKKGQLLFTIFNQAVVGELGSNQALLKLNTANLERQRKLVGQGLVSRLDYDSAIKEYEYSLGQVKKETANLSLGNIYAPLDGFIGIYNFNPGDYVKEGDALAVLSVLDDMELEFSVPAFYLNTLHNGDTVDFETPEFPNKVLHASIAMIDSFANQDTREILIYAYFKNTKPILLPGEFVDVTAYVGAKKPVFIVPDTALKYSLGGTNVFTIVDGKAHYVPVNIVQRRDKWVGVSGDLHANQAVISLGVIKVSNDTPVSIIKNTASS